jgi:hypothetical protein
VALTAATIIRGWECTQLPAKTGDIYRHLLTGVMVRDTGWQAATLPLDVWSPGARQIAPWTAQPYNYPPLALGFFVFLAYVGPSVLIAKLVLTALELLNACLVFHLTGSRCVAAVYWCLPLSIWWVSREAQFEPLQNTLVLLGLIGLRANRRWSWACWVAACQVKIFAVLLAPQFAWRWCALAPIPRLRALALAVLALFPTVLACAFWPVIHQTLSTFSWDVIWNPWHWRALLDVRYGHWCPSYLLLWMRCATLFLAGAIVWLGLRDRMEKDAVIAPLLFLIASVVMAVFQGWYFCALIPLVLAPRGTVAKLFLLALVQCCEPLSVYQLCVRPVGWGSPSAKVQVTEFMVGP